MKKEKLKRENITNLIANIITVLIIGAFIGIVYFVINLAISNQITEYNTTPVLVHIDKKDYSPASNSSIPSQSHPEHYLVIFSYDNGKKGLIDDESFYNNIYEGDTTTVYYNEFITKKHTVKYSDYTANPRK